MTSYGNSGLGRTTPPSDYSAPEPAPRVFGSSKWTDEDVKPGGRNFLTPLYNLEHFERTDRIYLVEGKKCADQVQSLGLVATTSLHPAELAHKTDWSPLAGRRVVILPTAGAAGARYADRAVAQLTKLNPQPEVRLVHPDDLGLRNDGYDIGQSITDRRDMLTLDDELVPQIEQVAAATVPLELDSGDANDAVCEGGPADRRSTQHSDSKGKPKEPTQAELLIELAGSATFFHTPEGDPYASFRVRHSGNRTLDRIEHHKVRSKAFELWLRHQFYLYRGTAPSSEAMQQALSALEACERFEGAEAVVHLRVVAATDSARHEYYIDLVS